MNTIRIVKSDAGFREVEIELPFPETETETIQCFDLADTIEVETNWTAEEVAVLAELDGGEWIKLKAGFNKWADSQPFGERDFHTYLRSHIQAEIKRQEGK